jgi:hypothetical protein
VLRPTTTISKEAKLVTFINVFTVEPRTNNGKRPLNSHVPCARRAQPGSALSVRAHYHAVTPLEQVFGQRVSEGCSTPR